MYAHVRNAVHWNAAHSASCRKGETTGAIIIAEIVLMHVHEGVAGKSPSGKVIVDIDKYEPIARLGGNFYGRIKEVFELSRPNSEQMRHRIEQLQTQVGLVRYTCSTTSASESHKR